MTGRRVVSVAVAASLAAFAALAFAQAASGSVRVSVTANGEAAQASVELLAAGSRAAAATGSSATSIAAPAGSYDVRVTLTEAIDRPVQTKPGVAVVGGSETAVSVDFEITAVILACRRGDESLQGTVRIRRPGASSWLPEVRCGERFLVSGGSYEAEVTVAGGSVVRVDRLQFMSGATQRVPVDIP